MNSTQALTAALDTAPAHSGPTALPLPSPLPLPRLRPADLLLSGGTDGGDGPPLEPLAFRAPAWATPRRMPGQGRLARAAAESSAAPEPRPGRGQQKASGKDATTLSAAGSGVQVVPDVVPLRSPRTSRLPGEAAPRPQTLRLAPAAGSPAAPPVATVATVATAPTAPTVAAWAQPRPTPQIRSTALSVAVSLAEAVAGSRSVHQLGSVLDLATYKKMERRATWERNARSFAGEQDRRPMIRVPRCHVQMLSAVTAECTATVFTDTGARAMSFRLELQRGRWRAVAVEMG